MSRFTKTKQAPANKDDNHFKEALKLYESKQYKKSIKMLETILKRNPNHAESYTLKGLALQHSDLPEKEEAEAFVLKGLKKNPYQPLACHIAGIYYRSLKDYAEAAKWYQAAMDNQATNKGIWRDLSTMQSQIRDFKSLPKSRTETLEDQPGYRAHWTGAAVAHYLNHEYSAAEKTLTKIEDIIADSLQEADLYEHSEAFLLKNKFIADSGAYERALAHIEELEKKSDVRDGLALLEYKADYLIKLGREKEASTVYRQLLKRNPDNAAYYIQLEKALGIFDKSPALRLALYEKLAKFYPRSDPPNFIPLTFLKGELFEKKLEQYILGQMKRGVPSTFVNVKPLYKRKSNIPVIFKIVNTFFEGESKSNPLSHSWGAYFLAQHYYHVQDYKKALEIIDYAIEITPTLVELYVVKARIYKRLNQVTKAAEIMNEGRLIDLQDRFINSKTTKYYLRANMIKNAVDTISLFTRNEESANGVVDLHTMQSVWFVTESAEAYFRLYKLSLEQIETVKLTKSETQAEQLYTLSKEAVLYSGLALKRFNAVIKIFEDYSDDQLDFHQYCMRKGTARTYLDMLKWGDGIFHQSVYLRSLTGYTNVVLDVLYKSAFFKETFNARPLKKSKKDKREDIKKREELITYSKGQVTDEDVFGEGDIKKLIDVKNKDKLAYLSKLIPRSEYEYSVETQVLTFRLNYELKKYVLCFQALNKVKALDASNAHIAYMYLTLHQELYDSKVQEAIKKILNIGLMRSFGDLLKISDSALLIETLIKTYLSKNSYETGLALLETNKAFASTKLITRFKEVQNSLDPYESNYLNYYK